jgi:CDP-paratose 2-epimerase
MSCIYGYRQFGTEDQGWIAHFIISSLLNKPLTIYGDGKQIRDILFVEDLINAFQLALNQVNRLKGQIYNIGGGPKNTISLLELIELLEQFLNRKIEYKFGNWRPGDQKVYYSNIQKAKRDFNWEPLISKEDGIQKLFKWVQSNIKLF